MLIRVDESSVPPQEPQPHLVRGSEVTGVSEKFQQARTALVGLDFHWVVDGATSYDTVLKSLPQVFSWTDSRTTVAQLGILGRSAALARLRSCFEFIGRYDSRLAALMLDSFEALPTARQRALMTAPETIYRLWRLRKEPATSVARLCTFLNAETIRNETQPDAEKECWTALGDFYHRGGGRTEPVLAPSLANGIPIDFYSPNVTSAKETTVHHDYLDFTEAERLLVQGRLQDAIDRIKQVSDAAAQMVALYVKVIIPFKVRLGYGSTSERSFPGRVLLQGTENVGIATIAAALVHEAIHQLLYTLEIEGVFVVREPGELITSLWSGRGLELHSFIHACFVWYGLAHFWSFAQGRDVFDEDVVQRELARCRSGFSGRNPIDTLGPAAGRIRYDVMSVARTLQSNLGTC